MNKIKYCAFALSATALTLPALAQDTSAADTAFTTFMTELKTSITDKVVEALPILGGVATVALVVFIAMWGYRKIKTFMGR